MPLSDQDDACASPHARFAGGHIERCEVGASRRVPAALISAVPLHEMDSRVRRRMAKGAHDPPRRIHDPQIDPRSRRNGELQTEGPTRGIGSRVGEEDVCRARGVPSG